MNKEWCIVTSTLCVCENITPLQLISASVQETLKKSIKSLNDLFDIFLKIKNSNVSFIIATCDVKRTRFLNISTQPKWFMDIVAVQEFNLS